VTAQELQDLNKELARETAEYQHLTETAQLTSRVFDYSAPLPKQPTYRPREWEPRVEYFGRLQVHQPAKPRKTL